MLKKKLIQTLCRSYGSKVGTTTASPKILATSYTPEEKEIVDRILYQNTHLKPEFPLFPWKWIRWTPEWLERPLPADMKDPWAKRDAWRHHPYFSARNRFLNILPGLGYATVAFSIYLIWDHWNMTAGPGSVEKKKWDEWLKERNERLHKEGHEGHH
ncbi:hypothetical protein HDU92_007158 [Lobulomyces angularis]|nr:hypothetical protein HDU92_007158 [Lobulomyces angularis]